MGLTIPSDTAREPGRLLPWPCSRRTSREALFVHNGNGRIDFADVVRLLNKL